MEFAENMTYGRMLLANWVFAFFLFNIDAWLFDRSIYKAIKSNYISRLALALWFVCSVIAIPVWLIIVILTW